MKRVSPYGSKLTRNTFLSCSSSNSFCGSISCKNALSDDYFLHSGLKNGVLEDIDSFLSVWNYRTIPKLIQYFCRDASSDSKTLTNQSSVVLRGTGGGFAGRLAFLSYKESCKANLVSAGLHGECHQEKWYEHISHTKNITVGIQLIKPEFIFLFWWYFITDVLMALERY